MGGDAGAVSVLSAHPLGNGYLELAEDDLHGEGPPHLWREGGTKWETGKWRDKGKNESVGREEEEWGWGSEKRVGLQ
jgi:hypothetical protein